MKLNLFDVFQGRKSMLFALGLSVLLLLVIEAVIVIVFALTAGEQSRIEVRDRSGKLVYDVAGTTLSHVNFSYFERKYGDLANYDVQVKTVRTPFPVRAWVSASVGIPITLILLVSYLVKVYLTLLQGGEPRNEGNLPAVLETMHPFVSWSLFVSQSSIFLLGAVIAGLALTFWMVPSLLGELAGAGAATLREGGPLVWGAAGVVACVILWMVYLRYRLSRRMMDYHYQLERRRLDHQFQAESRLPTDARPTPVETRGEPFSPKS